MKQTRRVGTLTAGVVLIGFGVLFLLRSVMPAIDYRLIVSLWPVILVLLGIELLISGLTHKEETMRYDGWAIVLILVLAGFAMVMAGAQFCMENAPVLRGIF